MKKALKKVVSSVMALTFCLAIPFAANAASVSSEEQDVLFTVEVNSEEELNDFLARLEAHNKRAQELWEAALARSKYESDNLGEIDENEISPLALAQSKATTSFLTVWPRIYATLGAYVDYDKVNDRFGEIYGIYVYGTSSSTTASNVRTDYTKLDSNRTLAVEVSALVGVKNDAGSMNYFPYLGYIEFYTSGKGTWYD